MSSPTNDLSSASLHPTFIFTEDQSAPLSHECKLSSTKVEALKQKIQTWAVHSGKSPNAHEKQIKALLTNPKPVAKFRALIGIKHSLKREYRDNFSYEYTQQPNEIDWSLSLSIDGETLFVLSSKDPDCNTAQVKSTLDDYHLIEEMYKLACTNPAKALSTPQWEVHNAVYNMALTALEGEEPITPTTRWTGYLDLLSLLPTSQRHKLNAEITDGDYFWTRRLTFTFQEKKLFSCEISKEEQEQIEAQMPLSFLLKAANDSLITRKEFETDLAELQKCEGLEAAYEKWESLQGKIYSSYHEQFKLNSTLENDLKTFDQSNSESQEALEDSICASLIGPNNIPLKPISTSKTPTLTTSKTLTKNEKMVVVTFTVGDFTTTGSFTDITTESSETASKLDEPRESTLRSEQEKLIIELQKRDVKQAHQENEDLAS